MNCLGKILFLGVLFVVVTGVTDRPSVWATNPVNVDAQGLAIEGYDPVTYFTRGNPIKGKKEFAYHWMGAEWYFASSGNLELFKSDPEKYAPQYGGY